MKNILLAIVALSLVPICSVAQITESAGTKISAEALKKLDPQIILALKQDRKEPPFDKPTSIMPDIPIREGDRLLIDLNATVSEELRNHITGIGGMLIVSPDPDHIIRVMIPLSQLEALADRPDIRSIAPGQLSIIRGIKTMPR